MFGKPEWFREKRTGWGLRPIAWQGWAYTAVWGTVIAGPFAVLALQREPTNVAIWLLASISVLLVDVWQIKKSLKPPVAVKKDPVLYIGDDDASSVSTKNLDLQLRR